MKQNSYHVFLSRRIFLAVKLSFFSCQYQMIKITFSYVICLRTFTFPSLFLLQTHNFFTMSSSSSNEIIILSTNASSAISTRVDKNREIDVKLVGLYCGSNGRSCCSHKICSQHVVPGDLLHLVLTVVEVDNK
jgi:hypothetical protein